MEKTVPKTIVILGNPSVGKSVLFGRLVMPGSSFPYSRGTARLAVQGTFWSGGEKTRLIDTPGILSLAPQSEDEKLTLGILMNEKPAAVIQVADSKNLDRSLVITQQLGRLSVPSVLALNMSDESGERGLELDSSKLSEILGIPVVGTVAVTGEGVADLRRALPLARAPKDSGEETDMQGLQKSAREIASQVTRITGRISASWARTFGRVSLKPWPGVLTAFLVILAGFGFVGWAGFRILSESLGNPLFERIVNPAVARTAELLIPSDFYREMLSGPYGIFTCGLTYALGRTLPILASFFLFFALLEDSGYLPRFMVLLDRPFRFIGLNGKALMSLSLGFCSEPMAVLSTRILDGEKERTLSCLLLTCCVPCLSKIMVVSAVSSWRILVLWSFIMAVCARIAGKSASRLLPGTSVPFMMEIPPIHIPQWRNIFKKVRLRISWYMKEVVPLYVLGSAFLFIFDKINGMTLLEKVSQPYSESLLGLRGNTIRPLLAGFFTGDFVSSGFFRNVQGGALGLRQSAVFLASFSLFIPSLPHFLALLKERGIKMALAVGGTAVLVSIGVGGLMRLLLNSGLLYR